MKRRLLFFSAWGLLLLPACGPVADDDDYTDDDDDSADDDDSGANDDDSAGPVTCVGDFVVDDVDTDGDLALITDCEIIEGKLSIDSTALTTLDALSSLTSVGWQGDPHALSIAGNDALTNLEGLSSLTSVGGGLFLAYNEALATLDGLSSLTQVGGYLNISSNQSLSGVDALSGLTVVAGHLYIADNGALLQVDGLSNLSAVGDWVHIMDNPVLCQSSVDAFIAACTIGGDVYLGNNDEGC